MTTTRTPPQNLQEYLARYHANHVIEGYGLEVGNRFPCPFCAAPDWMVARVLDTEEVMQKEHVCRECGRGARSVVERDTSGVRVEFVQTSGPDQPEWLEPKMRRA